MKIDVLTLFPEMFHGVLSSSILKRATSERNLDVELHNFRDYTTDKHNKVDDYPYGGGAGMVLAPQPIFDCVEALQAKTNATPRVILMCPQGERFTQKTAEALAEEEHLIFICGHYEGYDERIRTHLVTDELSIGDFVLTGGELPAMTIIDAVARLLPDVLGNEVSHQDDSHSTGLLEFPQYTRPKSFRGLEVPDVLLSGHHANVERWRMYESLKRTYTRRPDMLEHYELNAEQKKMLDEIKKSLQND
ncbi:MAG: tRNA (guanosine(37)-N1)-methyltransferase TrmD [Bacilli bacterium]